MKCLMIETTDKRKFFAKENYYQNLVEFSKTFNAKISIVKLQNGKPFELDELAKAFCDPTVGSKEWNEKKNLKYELIEEKSNSKRSRSSILEATSQIRLYLEEKFIAKQAVSLDDLKTKFKKYNLTEAALRNHFRKMKYEYEQKGFRFEKVKVGTYKVI